MANHPTLQNASGLKLSQIGAATLPFVGRALDGWMQELTIGVVSKTTVNFRTVETVSEVTFRGVKQPLGTKDLELKPEGERAWNWYMLHCEPSFKLEMDDIVIMDGKKHRVMGQGPFAEYGYNYYEIAEAFTE